MILSKLMKRKIMVFIKIIVQTQVLIQVQQLHQKLNTFAFLKRYSANRLIANLPISITLSVYLLNPLLRSKRSFRKINQKILGNFNRNNNSNTQVKIPNSVSNRKYHLNNNLYKEIFLKHKGKKE